MSGIIDPTLRPFLVNIAKRLDFLANDLKHDLNDLKSTLADSVKSMSID